MKQIVLFFAALSIVVGLFLFGCSSQQATVQPSAPPLYRQQPISAPVEEEPEPAPARVMVPAEYTIEMTADGFSPDTITINAGDTIVWANKEDMPRWPASAVHPTHQAYPGSGIVKCNTPAENTIFDACSRILSEGSYSFTFTEKGSWPYHDHLKPRFTGVVVVR